MSIFDFETGVSASSVDVAGKVVYIKHLTALERDTFETHWLKRKPGDSSIGIRAFIAAFCLCDKDGKQCHDINNKEEFQKAVDFANSLPANIVAKLADLALKVNGLSGEDVADLEKN